jgi:hypothetical protein
MAAAAAASFPAYATVCPPAATARPPAETLVRLLYQSLTSEQVAVIAKRWDDPLRSKVDNNWAITPLKIGQLRPEQQEMVRLIFRQVHSEEYLPKVLQQIHDDGGGIENYHSAIFGEPGTGKFEWVLTGRHMTIRCDGDSVEGAAFGGPIFYGHAARAYIEAADHPDNVYWYQSLRANEVFKSLDGKQREKAAIGLAPPEQGTATVALAGRRRITGLPAAELTRDQKDLLGKVMTDLLAPFRKADADEAMRYIQANGGIDSLTLAYYPTLDVGMDGVWDVWKLEGPSMIWYFRGNPHVHCWVNIAARPQPPAASGGGA